MLSLYSSEPSDLLVGASSVSNHSAESSKGLKVGELAVIVELMYWVYWLGLRNRDSSSSWVVVSSRFRTLPGTRRHLLNMVAMILASTPLPKPSYYQCHISNSVNRPFSATRFTTRIADLPTIVPISQKS